MIIWIIGLCFLLLFFFVASFLRGDDMRKCSLEREKRIRRGSQSSAVDLFCLRQLLTKDRNMFWGVDRYTYTVCRALQNRYADIISDQKAFTLLATYDQHALLPPPFFRLRLPQLTPQRNQNDADSDKQGLKGLPAFPCG